MKTSLTGSASVRPYPTTTTLTPVELTLLTNRTHMFKSILKSTGDTLSGLIAHMVSDEREI